MKSIRSVLKLSWNMGESGGSGGKTGKLVFAVVGLVVAAVILVVVVPRMNRPSATSLELVNTLGQVMAEETGKLLNKSGKVLILAPDPNTYVIAPTLKDRLTSFEQGVKKEGSITIVGTETLLVDPVTGVQGTLTPESLANFTQKYPDMDAIVAFTGAPTMTAKDLKSLPKKLPKIIVLALTDTPLKPLFQAGLVQVAIVTRFQPGPTSATPPKTGREIFDQSYQVVTSDNANLLPN